MAQVNQIISHLKTEPLTALKALGVYGIFRLQARITDLKHHPRYSSLVPEDHEIITTMKQDARGKRYAEYSLAVRKEAAA